MEQNAKKKISCGGFMLGEGLVLSEDGKTLSVSGGGSSVPKPLTYDYMPEGYPKKDGWSVEWDGNIDGKTSTVGAPFYKFSDMVLTYEEFLSAKLVNPDDPSQFIMVSEMSPEQSQVTDTIVRFIFSSFFFLVVSEDNAENQGIIFPTKGLYTRGDSRPFKLIKETITPMSADFMPVVDGVIISSSTADSTKKFKITVDDSGTLKATEAT